jgi:hypothetical protein
MIVRTATPGVSRRAFLVSLSSAAAASLSGGGLAGCVTGGRQTAAPAADAIAFEDFMRSSRELTGVDDLDPDLGRVYFAALDTRPLDAAAIMNAWYTGMYGDPHAPRVATHVGALAWSTLTFTKAPGVCGGGTGYWAAKPGTS